MSNQLSHKGYSGSVEISFEDNVLHGKVLFINDLITYEGNTPEELSAAFSAAVDRYVEHCKRTGKQPDRPWSGSFNVRVGASRHKRVCVEANELGTSLNDVVIMALDSYFATKENRHAKGEAAKTGQVVGQRQAFGQRKIVQGTARSAVSETLVVGTYPEWGMYGNA